MKVRDSGMPEETLWSSFFNVKMILDRMQVNRSVENLLEVGCGYGTFTIEAAKRITGRLFAFDIEQEMINICREKAEHENIENIEFIHRDIIEQGAGMLPETVDYIMLFNILHHEKPLELLSEAHRLLRKNGKVGIIHWRTDIDTPRGPDISIRPKPEQCAEWAIQKGFNIIGNPEILEPFHYGMVIQKN